MYGLVFAQLAVILAFVVAFSIDEFNQHFAKVNLWFSLVGSFLVGLLLFFLLACSSTVRRSHPFNLISLTTLSICEGWFIGEVTARGICGCRRLCYYSLYKKYSPRRPLLFPAWKSAHNWFRSRCCCRLWPYNSHLQVFKNQCILKHL